jgi:putative transposase
MTLSFDFNKASDDLQVGKDLTGRDGILMLLIKQLTEMAIPAELNPHLSSNVHSKRKTGTSSDTYTRFRNF